MLRGNLSSQQPAECYTKTEKKCGAWRQAKQKATTQQKQSCVLFSRDKTLFVTVACSGSTVRSV